MIVGIPREVHRHEHRVGMTPFGATRMGRKGHTVIVERHAGREAHFTDQDYERAGAQIVYDAEEIYQRSDLVCRVGALTPGDLEMLSPGTLICSFQHLAVQPKAAVERLMELDTTLLGYEMIRRPDGVRPILLHFGEMAGQMAVQLAAWYLQNEERGRGILLGNVPGVPPPTVLILGAGAVGRAAARQALVSGAHVIVMDEDLDKLRSLDREFPGRVVTVVTTDGRLERYTPIADVLIGAVLIPGARAPFLIRESMVKAMKPGSVILDISIDQGGCVETSRPTTLDDPVFTVHDVIHYCVPNMTANVARTASRALATAALPYLTDLMSKGLDETLRSDPGLAEGVPLYRGKLVNEPIGQALDLPVSSLQGLLSEREQA